MITIFFSSLDFQFQLLSVANKEREIYQQIEEVYIFDQFSNKTRNKIQILKTERILAQKLFWCRQIS